MFAPTFSTEIAAVWWYTFVQVNVVPETWPEFEEAILKQFIPEDHVRSEREQLRKLRQITSVAKHISEFRNLVWIITYTSGGEKLDKWSSRLKPEVR